MPRFHAVMIGEEGSEFGVDLEAENHIDAHDKLREDYPESRIDQLESDKQTQEREARLWARLNEEYENGY